MFSLLVRILLNCFGSSMELVVNKSFEYNRVSITLLSMVFFFWGLLTSLNSMLVPFLGDVFNLNHVESNYIQLAFYLAPFLVCLPIASLLGKVGYVRVIQFSLLLLTLGCFLFVPASIYFSYSLFLVAIFVLASGIAALQLAANPFAVSLGPKRTASSRLTFCSAMNSVGTTLASVIGMGIFMDALAIHKIDAISSVQAPYIIIGCSAIALAFSLKMMTSQSKSDSNSEHRGGQWRELLRFKEFTYGAFAIFFYVGSEVAVGTFLISYLTDDGLLNMSANKAGIFVSVYWGGALLGRLFGSAILKRVNPVIMLKLHSMVAVGLIVLALSVSGLVGAWSLALVGFCNSIMYPVIFSVASKGLGALVAKASAILIMCGIGGALVPLAQAVVADTFGLVQSFWVPIFGYLLVFSYGVYCKN